MDGFAACYYVPLKARDLSERVVTGYACSHENLFSSQVNKDEEFKRTTKMIAF